MVDQCAINRKECRSGHHGPKSEVTGGVDGLNSHKLGTRECSRGVRMRHKREVIRAANGRKVSTRRLLPTTNWRKSCDNMSRVGSLFSRGCTEVAISKVTLAFASTDISHGATLVIWSTASTCVRSINIVSKYIHESKLTIERLLACEVSAWTTTTVWGSVEDFCDCRRTCGTPDCLDNLGSILKGRGT